MPFWDRFKPKEVPRSKALEASSSLNDGAEFSLQSFGLALLQQQSALTRKQNVFISPLSIFLALAMTENGATGETKAAMRKVLALPADASDAAINASTAALLTSLQSQAAEFAVAGRSPEERRLGDQSYFACAISCATFELVPTGSTRIIWLGFRYMRSGSCSSFPRFTKILLVCLVCGFVCVTT